jgi:hypothetical protein
VALHDAPTPTPLSQPPAIAPPTSAQRLARAVGTEPETELDGTQSVSFPAPGAPGPAPAIPEYIPFSTAPVTVSRAIPDEDAGPEADGPPDHGAAAPRTVGGTAAPEAPAPAPAPEVDVDEIADTVIERLRRELLIERELGGGAMDLL